MCICVLDPSGQMLKGKQEIQQQAELFLCLLNLRLFQYFAQESLTVVVVVDLVASVLVSIDDNCNDEYDEHDNDDYDYDDLKLCDYHSGSLALFSNS